MDSLRHFLLGPLILCASCGEGFTPSSPGSAGSGGLGGGGSGGGSAGTSGSGGNVDDMPPLGGNVGPTGGTVDRLAFTVFGDVRPANVNDDANYPTTIITGIMTQAAATPSEFAIGTGDYMFANLASSVSNQVSKLLTAEQHFGKPIFHALGNHECTGFTASNCPNETESYNVRAFMMQLVPFAQRSYYSLDIQTQSGAAKFVFVAANAWDQAQADWLTQELARPTRYTFVIRHEPPGTTETAGAAASDPIIAAHPLTIGFYGHAHEYRHIDANHVISGNAGAPISRGNYGFLYVQQRQDGNIAVTEYREDTGQATDAWIVNPTGARIR